MTRINCGIPVEELSSKHLIAEHREIKRIPNNIKKGKAIIENIPRNFVLGSGHVKFFYNKQQYLKNRYMNLYEECKKRGINVQCYIESWDGIDPKLMQDYLPTEADRLIVRERIKERSNNK